MARRQVQPTYFQLSRSPHYSLVFAVPLLMAYEGLALFLNHSDLYGIRNSADAFLKLFLAYMGIHGFFGFGAAMVVALILFRFVGGGPRLGSIRLQVLVWMLAESVVYSLVFGAVVGAVTRLLLAQAFPLSRSAQILVSLGAGIYEEFVFRVLLLAVLMFLLHDLLRLQQGVAYGVAAVLGAVLFSAFHYIGPFGDPFQTPSFVFRFIAGLILTVLYFARGYGITAYTHSFYDLWITFGVI
ncbi:MAG TPA: CPBP family glutamic-type intramembrane protease [Candidatus Tectomicrobia bacterium]|nr:CPBP family glutamic-type intramembrane protease [Candidatus Tectomicrobia bacterium]